MVLAASGAATASAQADDPPAEADSAAADAADAAENETRARQLFADARDAYSAGRYAEAVAGFEQALELSGMGALYYNIGLAHDRLRHDQEAVEAYGHYLEETPDTGKRAEVEARIAAIERSLEQNRVEAEELAAARERAERTPETIIVREEEESSNLGLWLGIGGGIVALAVVGIILAVVLGGQGASYEQSDFGSVTFALGSQ
ncbi:MAG: hypothetical protein JRH11_17165 [Deltaproteobacteria bacterium]|nr:hypothetical protein [Deltaproteobacteria bacterium]